MNTNQLESKSTDKPNVDLGEKDCSAEYCRSKSIVVLGEKALCLQHFLTRCYEWLDLLDPAVRSKHRSAAETARVRFLVEECSNRALLVSLRCETLDNLDRSRLLDILLHSSDLLFLLRVSRNVGTWLPEITADTFESRYLNKKALVSPLARGKSYGI